MTLSPENAKPEEESRQSRIAQRIARQIGMSIPWSDMSARMMAAEDGALADRSSPIKAVIQSLMTGENSQEINRLLTELATSTRDDGLTGPVENEIGSRLLDAWNRFHDGEDWVAEFGPIPMLRAAIVSELIWAANEGRYRAGTPKPHHMDSRFDRSVFTKRLTEVIPSLKSSLESGRFPGWYIGATENMGDGKAIMIGLQDWQPTLRNSKGRKMERWSEPEIIPSREIDDSPQMSL